jgi:hypothetical protein
MQTTNNISTSDLKVGTIFIITFVDGYTSTNRLCPDVQEMRLITSRGHVVLASTYDKRVDGICTTPMCR